MSETNDKTAGDPSSLDGLVGVCPYCGGKMRTTCECGANNACDRCGRGAGQWPCECRPAKPSGLKQVW